MRVDRSVRPGFTLLQLLVAISVSPPQSRANPIPAKCPVGQAGSKRPGMARAAEKRQAVVELVGMKRWLRLTARKHSVGKPSANPAADAAADALSKMLGESRKLA
jgi:hypothetical protein